MSGGSGLAVCTALLISPLSPPLSPALPGSLHSGWRLHLSLPLSPFLPFASPWLSLFRLAELQAAEGSLDIEAAERRRRRQAREGWLLANQNPDAVILEVLTELVDAVEARVVAETASKERARLRRERTYNHPAVRLLVPHGCGRRASGCIAVLILACANGSIFHSQTSVSLLPGVACGLLRIGRMCLLPLSLA